MEGWIKLHRKCLDNKIFKHDRNAWHIFVYLLLSVNHKTGSIDSGRNQIAKFLTINGNTVYSALRRLEKAKMITLDSNNKYTTISISNWREYQDTDNKCDNNQTTTRQQPDNNQTTLYKNKERIIKNKEMLFNDTISSEKLKILQKQFPDKNILKEYESCKDYIKSTGKTYKDYDAMFRNWLRRSKNTIAVSEVITPVEIDNEKLSLIQKGKLWIQS